MAHVREQLAALILARLVATGKPSVRRRPSADPFEPGVETPGYRLWTEGDQAAAQMIGVPMYDRPVQFRIEAVIKRNDLIEETLNAMAVEIEAAMGPQFDLGGGSQPFYLFYRGAIFSDSAEGDQTVAVLSMRFEANLQTLHGAPEVQV